MNETFIKVLDKLLHHRSLASELAQEYYLGLIRADAEDIAREWEKAKKSQTDVN